MSLVWLKIATVFEVAMFATIGDRSSKLSRLLGPNHVHSRCTSTAAAAPATKTSEGRPRLDMLASTRVRVRLADQAKRDAGRHSADENWPSILSRFTLPIAIVVRPSCSSQNVRLRAARHAAAHNCGEMLTLTHTQPCPLCLEAAPFDALRH